jgi:NAD(P)-dependent dehydrogenase (short-subunit alcohol dehydrogenase family)
VILTGASMGIGEAAARAFGREARLASCAQARSAEGVAEEVRELGGEAVVIPADLSRPEEAARVVPAATAALGGVDVLVNNAGLGMAATFDQMRMEDLRYLMEVNLFSAVALMQAVLPHFRAQGGGVIVNVSSVVSNRPTASGYSATKFALNGPRRVARGPGRGSASSRSAGAIRLFPRERSGTCESPSTRQMAAGERPAARSSRRRIRPRARARFDQQDRRRDQRISPGFVHWALGRAYAVPAAGQDPPRRVAAREGQAPAEPARGGLAGTLALPGTP